jgi:hypothetical protein
VGKGSKNQRREYGTILKLLEHQNIVGSLIYLVQDHNRKQRIEKVITKPIQVYILIG